jgi:hypothetical protein
MAGCGGCIGRDGAASGDLSLGGTINRHILLGVGSAGWSKYYEDEDVTVSGGTLDVRLRVYPSSTSGGFLTVGLGLGIIEGVSAAGVGAGSARLAYSEVGAGALLGFGWDLRVGRNVSVTPFYNRFAVSTATLDGKVDQVGFGITIH